MKKKNIFNLFCFLVAVVISLWVIKKSIFLRWFGYENYPAPMTDEFTYVWQAISLKRNGLPMAWTLNSGIYNDKKFNPILGKVSRFGIEVDNKLVDLKEFRENPKPILAVKEIDYSKGKEQVLFVAPFFDHPPLGGFIYSLGVSKNVKEVEEVKTNDFRKPALVMGILTSILLFIFLTLITSSPWAGTLGVIVYATAPTYLLATRTAFLENAVPPFVLLNLILLFLYIKYSSKKLSILFLIFSGLFSGLAVLAKEPGIGFLIGSLIIMWQFKIKIKNILIFLISASIPLLTYLIWGLWLQGPLFLDILLCNTSRWYFGSIKIVTMLEALKFKNFPTDGWWIWGILSFILVSVKVKNKNLLLLIVPTFVHILVVLLLGSANYPWYWISAIPFFAASAGIIIWRIFKNPSILNSLIFFFIPFSSSYYWGREALGILPSISHYRMAAVVFGLMLFFRLKFKKYPIIIFWIVFMAWMMYKVIIFNEVFMPYLIAHWGNLSILSLPNY